jgi:hypothetical protein
MKEILLKKGDQEYKLVYNPNIQYDVIMLVMNNIIAGKNAEAGDVILLKQMDYEKSSPEVLSNPFVRASAAIHMLSLYEAFEIEEKKS